MHVCVYVCVFLLVSINVCMYVGGGNVLTVFVVVVFLDCWWL